MSSRDPRPAAGAADPGAEGGRPGTAGADPGAAGTDRGAAGGHQGTAAADKAAVGADRDIAGADRGAAGADRDTAAADPGAAVGADRDTARTAPAELRFVVSRTVPAAPSAVFALLADPARHHETEPTDWVRGSLEEDPAPLTEVGQEFGIEMFHVNTPGRYDMHNRVIAFERDRTIAWKPGQYGHDGAWGSGGWTWRYDLAPEGETTRVTLTYDWSRVPVELRERFGLPPFAPEFLERSLAALEKAVTDPSAPEQA